MGKLSTRLKAGELAIGATDTIGSSRLLEVLGYAGVDMVNVDQMFCPMDWTTIAHMVRAGRNYGIDVFVRIQSYPWLDVPDRRLPVDAVRALGVGAEGVLFSPSCVTEIEQVMGVARDWHRDIHIHAFNDDRFDEVEAEAEEECLLIPLIESAPLLRDMEDLMSVPGLRAISLGMTDITRVCGYPFQYEHPDVLSIVQQFITSAHQKGIFVGGNVGYAYSRSGADMVERIDRMTDQGFDFVWMQNDGFVIQWLYKSLLEAARANRH